MTEDVTRIWRMGLPADWTPPGYWCVSFVIPEGDDYVQALQGAIGLLTLSKTWERDDTHEGAITVAKTWEKALYLQPMTVSETCTPVPVPPIPDEAAAEDASAAIFTVFMQHVIQSLNGCALVADDCPVCVDDLMAELSPYGASQSVQGALQRLCYDLNQLPPEDRGIYETDCPYEDEFSELADNINDNPYDWLNKLSDWLFEWLNHTSDAILNDLATIGALMGGDGIQGFINDHGGIPAGGGADFGFDCGTWVSIADFTIDDQGYAPAIISGVPFGEYITGVGWRTVYVVRGGNGQQNIQLFIGFDARTITYIKMTFDAVEPPDHAPTDYMSLSDGISDFQQMPNPSGSGLTIEYTDERLSENLGAAGAWVHLGDPSNPGGSLTVTRYEIHGKGEKPAGLP